MFEGKERITFKLSCIDCGMEFIAKSKSALRCPECRKKDNCERSRESRKKSRAKRRLIRSKSPLQQKSIQPKWCGLIASGKKTIEVRKTKPKLETPFKVYIYCTKNTFDIRYSDSAKDWQKNACGKVIGEFMCKCISEWHVDPQTKGYFITSEELTATCLTYEQLHEYGNGKTLYGWHISNLVIYDKPRELREFKSAETYGRKLRTEFFGKDPCCANDYRLTRPPQSWCYVESEVQGE